MESAVHSRYGGSGNEKHSVETRGGVNVKVRVILISMLFVSLLSGVALAAGPFSGSWEVNIGLSPQQTKPFSAFSSTLNVNFSLSFLTLKSSSDFIIDGWLWQQFGLCTTTGFISFDGLMLFQPQSGLFLYTQGILTLDFNPFVVRWYSAMTGADSSYGLNYGSVLNLSGNFLNGTASFESSTFFGADLSGISFTQTSSSMTSSLLTKTYTTDPTISPVTCDLCFSGEVLTFKAEAFGCIDLTSTTTFSTAGFKSQEFELVFKHLFGAPLDLTLTYSFSLQSASHTFTPSLETNYGCLTVYSHLLGSGGSITGIEIYGIEFSATLGGTTFRSISNLNTTDYVITTPAYGSVIELKSDADANAHVYYPQKDWEIISLTAQVPPSGWGVIFSTDTFFSTGSGFLFDWDRTDMKVTLDIGSLFTCWTGVTVDTTGFTEWTVGMKLRW